MEIIFANIICMYFDGFPSFDSQCEIIKYNATKKYNTGIKNHCASFGSEQKKEVIYYWISFANWPFFPGTFRFHVVETLYPKFTVYCKNTNGSYLLF